MGQDYVVFLDSMIDEIFEEAAAKGWTWGDLARESNLTYQTIWRLGNYATRLPRLQTFYKMAKAVGKLNQFKKRLRAA